ncbi:cellular retinoic acid-binding protein 1 isoform X1 [Narcine bancroftii]|uniref:cellular retinoic acid-binding protein 1 isoform X1 n=1 Tax=Narcine bancroftii TaxID=1343680 RepID=UPI00383222D3
MIVTPENLNCRLKTHRKAGGTQTVSQRPQETLPDLLSLSNVLTCDMEPLNWGVSENWIQQLLCPSNTLHGVNAMLRKVAVAAASKPLVEIRQDGDQFYIKTSTTVRTTEINFTVGEEFEEETVDGRKCKSLPKWENENKIYCKQTLLNGAGPKTHWTRELVNNELILTLVADDVVCTRIYVKE